MYGMFFPINGVSITDFMQQGNHDLSVTWISIGCNHRESYENRRGATSEVFR